MRFNMNFFIHLKLLTLTSASQDANGIFNSTITFIRSRWLKKMCHRTFFVMWCYWYSYQCHMMPRVSSMAPLNFLHQEDQNWMQHDLLGHVMSPAPASASSDANDIIHTTTGFVWSRLLKWGISWLLVMWCIKCLHWHHVILMALSMAQ